MVVKQKAALQFPTLSYSIILQGLENSNNSYGINQKYQLSADEQELHAVWNELHSSKYIKNFRNVY